MASDEEDSQKKRAQDSSPEGESSDSGEVSDDSESDEQPRKDGTRKRRCPSAHVRQIRFDHLRLFFETPMPEAAKKLNVSLATLRKICRREKIREWPYKQIKALEATIKSLEEDADTGDFLSGQTEGSLSALMCNLYRQKQSLVVSGAPLDISEQTPAGWSTVLSSLEAAGGRKRGPKPFKSQAKTKPKPKPSKADRARARDPRSPPPLVRITPTGVPARPSIVPIGGPTLEIDPRAFPFHGETLVLHHRVVPPGHPWMAAPVDIGAMNPMFYDRYTPPMFGTVPHMRPLPAVCRPPPYPLHYPPPYVQWVIPEPHPHALHWHP